MEVDEFVTLELFGLSGKNVLVIGGGLGMGEATSTLLASVGANVAVLDIVPERAERVAALVRAHGTQGIAVVADATDEAQLVAAIKRTDEELGGIDGLVCIVGMASWAPILDMDTDTWDLDHRRNLRYFFVAAREVARIMINSDRGGSIVGICSVDGLQSSPFHSSYGAAKAGLINLVRSMTAEWLRSGVRVNAVAPGSIVTPRNPLATAEEEAERFRVIPARRRGTVEVIANAALFLLSDLSTYVSGQTIAVDGGYTAVGPVGYEKVIAKAGLGGTLGVPASV